MKNLDAATVADATSAFGTLTSNEPHDATRRMIPAAVIGNTLEWFDFAVYGFFAITISKLFFPTGDETSSLLLTVATFGVGFVMRPIGAVILGALGDTHGRKAALSTTILLMALGTARSAWRRRTPMRASGRPRGSCWRG